MESAPVPISRLIDPVIEHQPHLLLDNALMELSDSTNDAPPVNIAPQTEPLPDLLFGILPPEDEHPSTETVPVPDEGN